MAVVVKIENGFAEVGGGSWLMGRGQPAAFRGTAVRRRRKGWCVRDRGNLDLVETTGMAKCADSSRPFLTHIPCAEPVFAVSGKVLVAPASARRDAQFVKVIPMSARNALCVTEFGERGTENGERGTGNGERGTGNGERGTGNGERGTGNGERDGCWVVTATAGRTARLKVPEGETLSVRPEAAVAWTGKRPTGFCPKLSIWDVILPRGPRDLLLTFYGPCLVWIEGSNHNCQTAKPLNHLTARRAY